MAHGKSLLMRAIRSTTRQGAHVPNEHRRQTKAEAKNLSISRRRLLRRRAKK